MSEQHEEIIFDGKKYIREDLIIGCTPTERAFLDEIREKGVWTEYNEPNMYIVPEIKFGQTTISNDDFPDLNLQELVNG